MKKMLIMMLLCICFLPSLPAKADTYTDLYAGSGLEETRDALPQETQAWLDELMPELTAGNLSGEGMLEILLGIFRDGFSAPMKFLLICISVILLYTICMSIGEREYSAPAEYISVLVIVGSCILPLLALMKNTGTAVSGVGNFMLTFIPVFAGILIAGGRVTSAGGFSALLLFAAEGVGQIFSAVVLPLLSMFTSLSISSACTDLKISGLLGAIKKAAGWILTLTLTLFTGVLGLQTTVTSAADSLSLKTVRFAAGSFLPVVGGAVGEAVGTVSSCLSMLRSTAGAYGVLCIALLLLPVLAELIAWRLVVLLCEGVSELFGADKIKGLLSSVGSAASLLIGIVVWTGLLFIISLTVVMKAGGGV